MDNGTTISSPDGEIWETRIVGVACMAATVTGLGKGGQAVAAAVRQCGGAPIEQHTIAATTKLQLWWSLGMRCPTAVVVTHGPTLSCSFTISSPSLGSSAKKCFRCGVHLLFQFLWYLYAEPNEGRMLFLLHLSLLSRISLQFQLNQTKRK